MKLFLVGDFKTDTGPGNANKQIKNSLSLNYSLFYSKETGWFKRIKEVIVNINLADIVLICSKSNINYITIKYAKLKKKKIIYLMHGYNSLEEKIENPNIDESKLKKIRNYEKFVFSFVDRIVCVSKRSMLFMKDSLPQYANKMDYIYNVVDIKRIQSLCEDIDKDSKVRRILSIGGGMRRKNNLSVAKAVNNLNFVIVGHEFSDGKKIRKFSNVTWYEQLTNREILTLMAQSRLYVQNSVFDTFCISVVEALYAGCSILVSNSVGCLDLFDNLREEDVIYNVYDKQEISRKIFYLLEHPNNERLRNNFKESFVSREWQLHRWQEIFNTMEKNY